MLFRCAKGVKGKEVVTRQKWSMSTPNFEPITVCTQRVEFAQRFLERFELRFDRPPFLSQSNKPSPEDDECLVKRKELDGEYGYIVLHFADHGL